MMRVTAPKKAIDRLTKRELESLKLLSQGHTNIEIAEQLGIGPGTVRTHIYNLMRKLDVDTRGRAAAIYYRERG